MKTSILYCHISELLYKYFKKKRTRTLHILIKRTHRYNPMFEFTSRKPFCRLTSPNFLFFWLVQCIVYTWIVCILHTTPVVLRIGGDGKLDKRLCSQWKVWIVKVMDPVRLSYGKPFSPCVTGGCQRSLWVEWRSQRMCDPTRLL